MSPSDNNLSISFCGKLFHILLPLPLIKGINIEYRANQLVFIWYASTGMMAAQNVQSKDAGLPTCTRSPPVPLFGASAYGLLSGWLEIGQRSTSKAFPPSYTPESAAHLGYASHLQVPCSNPWPSFLIV